MIREPIKRKVRDRLEDVFVEVVVGGTLGVALLPVRAGLWAWDHRKHAELFARMGATTALLGVLWPLVIVQDTGALLVDRITGEGRKLVL